MALRVLSLLISLVVLGVLATSMRSRLQSSDETGVTTPESLLRQTGTIVERSHQITGTYGGLSATPGSPIRLVSADASGYCLELTWLNRPYHLRGPGGTPAAGAC